MLVYGREFFGRVDRVPGMFHVKTMFLHIGFIPLVPKESWVLEDNGRDDTGHRIPLCWKSVLVAWSRCVLVYLLALAGVMVFLLFAGHPDTGKGRNPAAAWIVLALMAVLAGAYALTYRWARPSEHRAYQLANWMDVDPSEVADRLSRPRDY